MEVLFTLIGFGILLVYSSLSWGFIAWKFYGWFILPSLPQLPQFSVIEFMGFIMFLGVVMPKTHVSVKKEYKEDGFDHISTLVLLPWMTLFFGWILYSLFF